VRSSRFRNTCRVFHSDLWQSERGKRYAGGRRGLKRSDREFSFLFGLEGEEEKEKMGRRRVGEELNRKIIEANG